MKEKYEEIILDELKEEGHTIKELEREYKKITMDEEQKVKGKQKEWHRMDVLNKIITKKLDIIQTETLRKTTAKIMSNLREEGKIIDIKYKSPRYGVWRLTSEEEKKIILNFKNKKYTLDLKSNSYMQKLQERQLTNLLFDMHNDTCQICWRKNLGKQKIELEAVPIIRKELIRKLKETEILNPKNYLLLCGLCKNAFNNNMIIINEDYTTTKTQKFTNAGRVEYLKKWVERCKINKKIILPLNKSDEVFPDKEFLKIKKVDKV